MSDENNIRSNNSRVFAGVFIIAIGVLFFLKQSHLTIFPYWFFTWPMILIAVGIFSGVKHGFRGGGWLVMILIGSFFLLDDVMDMYSLRPYLVPAILVGVGLMLILRPKNRDGWISNRDKWKKRFDGQSQSTTSSGPSGSSFKSADYAATDSGYADTTAEYLDATAIFGAVKKNILSKNFQGGDATSIFGGSEIDLSKADINGTVKIDVTAILGGVKLVVPSHWTVKQEIAAIFGGVEDKRDTHSIITVQNKVLVLRGTAFMGGIEITSYR
jgi:predicted membrane protein